MMRFVLPLLLFFVLLASVVEAQPRGRPRPQFIDPEQLDPGEGERVLQAFRTARLEGDYAFIFELRHMPRSGPEKVHAGTMWGSWLTDGRGLTRVHLLSEGEPIHLLQIGGQPGAVYRQQGDQPTELLTGDEKFKPLVPGITFSPFELQMPFLFWTDYVYEGTRKFRGRPSHYFLLYPPSDFQLAEVGAVRVVIDADFNAMLRAEILDTSSNMLKSFRVNSFKKTGNQWIVKTIDLMDETSREKTRFEVKSAAVGLDLPEETFDPDTLPDDIAPVQWQQFDRL